MEKSIHLCYAYKRKILSLQKVEICAMNKNKEMKFLKYRMLYYTAAALLSIGGLIYFNGSQEGNSNTNTSTPSVSANLPFHFSENIFGPALSVNEVPLTFHKQENPDDNSYLPEEDSYTDTKDEETLVMTASDRCTYQEGFFYQSITDDIKMRINGLSYKSDCTVPYEDLRYVSVLYEDFNGETQTGEIICNKAIAQDLVEIFYELYLNHYQIDKIRLIDEYDADDDLSCADNNTSCFNFRKVYGSDNLSKHALGLAIDINPFQNPYVTYPDGVERISPPGSEPYADRDSGLPHIISEDDLCYQLFTAHGFTWGGHWRTLKDYQHFQKEL